MPGDGVFVPGKGVVSAAEAQAIAQEFQHAQAGQRNLTLFSGPGGDQNVELQNMRPLDGADPTAGLGDDLMHAAPMLASLASLHPGVRAIRGAAFGIPAIVEGIRQKLQGEPFDPGSMAQEGLMSEGAGMIGKLARGPAKLGRSMIGGAIAKGEGPVAAEGLVNTAVREGGGLTAKQITELTKRSVELENQMHAAATAGNKPLATSLRTRVGQLDQYIAKLKGTAVSGASTMPGVTARPTGVTLSMPQMSPKMALDAGQKLTTGEKVVPGLVETLMRLLGADLSVPEGQAPAQ